jgi:hypothetical protein
MVIKQVLRSATIPESRDDQAIPCILYLISNVRLVLDVEVQSGKSHAAKHSLPRLRQLIERLAAEKRPALVRGDSAFGNEGVMTEMEQINQRYLFKLR